mmetsp:Transcript_14869/g.20831  ORF Transcript_14869/g.20831 Transcript_14869/m.20831 type:complete len:247 (+) Transcript_14869:1465-2205(+)
MATGIRKHQKRISSNTIFRFDKTSGIFNTKISQGPYDKFQSITLFNIVKKYLKFGHKFKEIRRIIKQGNFYVDGKMRLNYKYPIGLMDVISIPKIYKSYRLLLSKTGKVKLYETKPFNKNFKICKIISIIQKKKNSKCIITHDKKEIRISSTKAKINDSILLQNATNQIIYILKFKIGNLVLILFGKHIGSLGVIYDIKKDVNGRKFVYVNKFNGQRILKSSDDLMVIGESKIPFMSLDRYYRTYK